MTAEKKDDRQGYGIAVLSIVVNVILFVAKYVVAVTIGSAAIMADAWHAISDSLTSLIVIVGLRIAGKPADERHEFGHGRAEVIASLIIGAFIGFVAFDFILEGIAELQGHDTIHYGMPALVVIVISIIAKEILAQCSFRVGKNIGSQSLQADGWHHRSDALSSIVIVVGIVISPYVWWIDGVMAIMIALMMMCMVVKIFMGSVDMLMGKRPDDEFIVSVHRVLEKVYPEDVHPHHLHIHQYGHHVELTLHIKLPRDMTLEQGHAIASLIEDALRDELDVEPTIHVEPLNEKVSL